MANATAPASSANLGAGFDTLALALEMRCEVEATRSDSWEVTHAGPEVPPRDAADRVLASARLAASETRALSLIVRNQIPVGMGLGASAAASVAGYAASRRALELPASASSAFRAASELDGHGDNAAAATFGGLVAVTLRGGVVPLQLHPKLAVVIAVPQAPLPTERARSVLPDPVDRGVAVRSIARVVALTEGLREADPELLEAAMGDELHEEPREILRPEIKGIITSALDAGAAYACWSGAGPSVLAIAIGTDTQRIVANAFSGQVGEEGRVLTPEVAPQGLI